MSRTIRLLILALGSGALLAPAAAHASPTQTSIMMDDDLLVYRDDSTAAQRADADEVARRRHRPRDRPVEDRRREHALHEGRDREAQGQAQDRARAAPEQALQGRPTRARTRSATGIATTTSCKSAADRRHPRLLQRHRPRPDVGAREAAAKSYTRLRSDLEAQARGVQAVRAGGRQALRRDLPRRERQPRHCCPRVRFWSLWNEPNQAGWLSPQWERRGGAIVPASPALYRKLHQYGYRGPARHRPPRRHRHHPHGRDGAAGLRRAQRARRRCVPASSCARSRASSPTARRTRAPPRRRATAATSPRAGR